MAKRKQKPKTSPKPAAANLPKMCNSLGRDVDTIAADIELMRAAIGKATRAVDPCANEQVVYDAAVHIATDLFEAAVVAAEIAMAAQAVLMSCRMGNP